MIICINAPPQIKAVMLMHTKVPSLIKICKIMRSLVLRAVYMIPFSLD